MKKKAPDIVYEDNLVQVSSEDIRLFKFHFPFCTSKEVLFSNIDRIEEFPVTYTMGSLIRWGTRDFKTWFPLDANRLCRNSIFLIHLRDTPKRYGLTVENEESFREAMGSVGIAIKPGSQDTVHNENSFGLGITAVIIMLLGVIFIACAVPFIAGKIAPNDSYGLRVKATLENEQVWYATHVFAGWALVIVGLLVMYMGSVLWKKREKLVPTIVVAAIMVMNLLVLLACGASIVYAAIISN